RRELIDARNQADQMIYSLEKLMRDNRDKIPEDEAKRVQQEIEKTKKAMESDDINQIKQAMESLSQASHKLTELMYQQAAQQQAQQQQAQQQTGGETSSQASSKDSSEEDVIDAEVVDEEKEDKK
ncbi:MAG: Hsp70 family protein, partial [Candidatus Aminicenantales bacterium]